MWINNDKYIMSINKKFFVGAFIAAFAVVVGSASAAYMHTTTLKQGSVSSQVWSLQQTLNMTSCKVAVSGAGAPGFETSSFGPKTKAAVMCFQASNGLTADGVVGPMTGSKLALVVTSSGNNSGNFPAGCTSAAGYSSVTGQPCSSNNSNNSGSLQGGAGALNDVDLITSINNEEVGEGEEDVKIVGLEVEADNGSDISLTSVRVEFEAHASGTGSDDLDDYADEVTLWLGDEQIGSADVDDFSEDSGVWTKSINVSSAVISSGESEDLHLAITALENIDSDDTDSGANNWMATIANIRFRDAQGAFTTDDSTGALPAGRDFNFVSFSSAADTELRISKDSDSPEAGIVIVDDSDETEGVVLLTGKLRLEGESDVNIDQIPVTFTVGSGMLDETVSNLTLVLDGEEYDADSVATTSGSVTSTITFDDLDFDLAAGETIDYEIRADIFGTDDAGEGDTITASITADNRSAIDAEDEEGEQVADGDKTGTAVGEALEFRSEGVSVTLVETEEDVNSDATLGTYTIKFKVSAVGDDAYIGTATTKYTYALRNASSGTTTAGVSASITNEGGSGNSTSTTTGGNWKINEGTSVTLTLQVFANGGSLAGGAYRAELTALGWDSSDADAALDNSYTSNLEDFHTDYEQLI
jgi:peptidoglycan hydrolase-like protein with peptidoglycan-binding domain